MSRYKARFKGMPIKGMGKSDVPADDEEEDVEEEPKTPKAKDNAATPEKKVVRDILGIQDKKSAKGKKEVGEKGSSKSGNYGHAGIPGHKGGSRPKGGAVTGTGAAPKSDDAARAQRIADNPWSTEAQMAKAGKVGQQVGNEIKVVDAKPAAKAPAQPAAQQAAPAHKKGTAVAPTTKKVSENAAWNARATVLNKVGYGDKPVPPEYAFLNNISLSGIGNRGRQALVDLADGKITIADFTAIFQKLPKR